MTGAIRAVVIGAGANGLVCAAHLARGGAEVTVLEQSEADHGGISSAEGPLPGFRHDVCAGFFPLTLASPAFRSLDLDGVEWITPSTVMAHPFLDGSALALERDIGATARGLGAAGQAYSDFMAPLASNYEALMASGLLPFPPIRPMLQVMAGLRLRAPLMAWRSVLPAATAGRRWLKDERATAWLSGSTAHSDLDPMSPGGGAFALTLKFLGHAVGWPFPRGGAQAIAAALKADIAARGAVLRQGVGVEEILTTGRRATGVRLAGGERIDADVVIATVSARPFLDLVGAHALPAGVTRRLRNWRHDAGTFKVDFALDRPVPWTAEKCREAGVVHLGDTVPAFMASFRAARAGDFPEVPALVIGQHSLFDPTRAPAGKHTLYAYVRSPLALKIDPDRAADIVEERIEQFAPGFRASVLGRAVRSPEALEAKNPSMIGGDLGGGSYQFDHQLVLRPHPRMFRTRTPIRGLYLAGTSVHPGGGVHGAQGYTAARMALGDRY